MVDSRPSNWPRKKSALSGPINLGVINSRLHTSVHFRDRSCGGNHRFWQQVPQLQSADSFTRHRSYLWMEWTLTASVMQLLNIQVTQMRQQRGGYKRGVWNRIKGGNMSRQIGTNSWRHFLLLSIINNNNDPKKKKRRKTRYICTKRGTLILLQAKRRGEWEEKQFALLALCQPLPCGTGACPHKEVRTQRTKAS